MPKRRRDDRIDALVRCARLFYEDRRTKSEIAHELAVSAMQVKRFLDEALTRGIVRISVVERRDFLELEGRLTSKYSLKAVRVAPHNPDYERQKSALGETAATLFDELVTLGTSVGIGGGGSLKAMVDSLQSHPREIDIAPTALVGRGPRLEHVDAAFLASLLYYKSSPKARAAVIGMLPPLREERRRKQFTALVDVAIPEVQVVLDQARRSSIAFVGLGGPDPVAELEPVLDRTQRARRLLTRRQAVGGINYNYFDHRGAEVESLFKTLGISDLQAMTAHGSIVVVVAGGPHKHAALDIALRTSMANALVTDEKTALRLAEMTSTSPTL